MVNIYPTKVKHTTKDNIIDPARDYRGYGTQLLYNDTNILTSSHFACWGSPNIKKPNNSPKTIATPSGTRRQPEEIILTTWDVSSIPDGAKITSVKVEVKYFTEKYDSYDKAGYFPDKTTIKFTKNNNSKIGTGTIHGPTTTNKEYSHTFSSLNLSKSDLKNSNVSVVVGENKQYGVECKVKIQYVRMSVTYIDPNPKYEIILNRGTDWTKINTPYTYTLKIKNNTSYNKKSICYVTVPKDATVNGLTKHQDGIYKVNVNGTTDNIPFTVTYKTLGNKTVSAKMSSYGVNTPTQTVIVKQPQAKITFTPIIVEKGTSTRCYEKEFYEETKSIQFELHFERDIYLNNGITEYISINSVELISSWDNNGINFATNKGDGNWIFNKIPNTNNSKFITKSNFYDLNDAGTFRITGEYYNNETEQRIPINETIKVKSIPLRKNYFKLKLEDGTDVQYNSLSFAQGDDLKNPLTYDTEDYTPIKAEDFIITGETKRIPVDEAEYISFNIELKKEDTEIENVLSYIEAYTENGRDCSDIIVGIDNNGTLFEGNDKKYCLIKKISSSKPTVLKLAVQSETEQNCIIKIRPYNYDLYETGQWKPSKVVFKDLPNVKIYIDGDKNDIASGDKVTILYHVENKSDIEGKNLKYKIKEPNGFEVLSNSDVAEDYGANICSFNTISRVWQFKKMPAHSREYTLAITYKATKKGVYDFIMTTLDNENTTEDDQHKNYCSYQVMVDIISDVNISTSVNYHQPEVNQLIDYVIKVTNRLKHQDRFYFEISDIGDFNINHNDCHYTIENIKTDKGEFRPKTNDDPRNIIGKWELTDIPINATYKLTLSLRPTQTGLHSIKTVFTNPQKGNIPNGEQIFTDRVKVLENKKQIAFDVYHAVNDDDIDCSEITCDNLIRICDNDYINLSDSIYYIIKITNNSRLELKQPINIYARLPNSFLDAYCSSPNSFIRDENTNLLNYQLQSIPGCKEGPTYIFLKTKPSEIGEFTSNFMLSTKTADVLHKTLHLTVDNEFSQRELEHEIKIYNFDKTNKYYRYEIDNQGEIFKFFNTGDKTVRPIETESYDVNSVETYTGSNLKEIVRDIKKNSKYVDPVFLRQGSNKLKDKGYELYPDGLIRRFGLLKSEVFHYTNQLPITSDLIEKTMKWDIDEWDTKMWAGGDYDNGVFDLTVDYDKIPSNFDINDAEGLVKNLQAIVDKTKPYGTKGKCYCSSTVELGFGIQLEDVQMQIQQDIELNLNIDDIYLLTTYNRSDNSLAYFHDAIQTNMNLVLKKVLSKYNTIPEQEDTLSTGFNVGVPNVCVYEASMKKQYINDVTDILNNLYNTNNNTNNIDITIPYQDFTPSSQEPNYIGGYQAFNYVNNHASNQLIGLSIKNSKTQIDLGYIEELDFKGFQLKYNDKIISKRIVYKDVENFSVMSQAIDIDSDMIIHFWVSTNNEEYYHIGFINFTNTLVSEINRNGNLRALNINTNTPTISFLNGEGVYCQHFDPVDENNTPQLIPITFKISDRLKTITKQYDNIKTTDKKWYDLDKINNNGYAYIDYNSNVDKECDDKTIKVPKILAKYNNIKINRLDEITNIDFKITAQSNKENFIDDININLLKDGDYYYTDNGISRKIYYPEKSTNIDQQMLTRYVINQTNLTICNDCLRTSLGFYDECKYCHSNNISHYDKMQPVTVCESCGWVTNGTHTYCHHCLSKDVENTDVDYNKTYCYNCETLSDDYYQYCPKCFSSDTIYLDNKKTAYTLEKNQQNIEPIVIKTKNIEDDINIFDIEIPFGKDSDALDNISKLTLNIECTNHNNGTYYYCEDCQSSGLGNYIACPECNSQNIQNKTTKNNTFEAYLRNNAVMSKVDIKDNNILEKGKFTKSIDLLKIAKNIVNDSFTLQFYVNNPNFNANGQNSDIESIDALDIDDEYKQKILDNVLDYDFTIDNIYVDYDFITKNNEWIGEIEDIQGEEHTGIKYIFNNERKSEPIVFKGFNIEKGYYTHAYLYLAGVCKSTNHYSINLEITDANHQVHTKSIKGITDTLFNQEIDLVDIIGGTLNDIKVSVSFEGDNIDDIVLTECNILAEKESNDEINELMNDAQIRYEERNDCILFKSNNMWGLKDTTPYHVLSGRSLESNLLAYIDFGELHSKEYIRLYNIDMVIYYQSKTGKITTESIPVYDENKLEQFISGTLHEEGGKLWGFIEEDIDSLNNLEYENVHIDEEGKLSNSIPLNKKIAQSFICQDNEISKINLEYFGKKGYPSDIISIALCEDYNNAPGDIIAQSQINMPNKKEVINIDFDVNELNIEKRYWIVLEDLNANETNYHRFNYNTNKIGTLIKENKVTDAQSLCFSIETPLKVPYYNLPIMWTISSDTDTIDLVDTITDTFYYDEEMETLMIKVLKAHGNPNTEVICEIYDDIEMTNKIKDDEIIQLTTYRSNIHIDINSLEKNKQYYIKIIPKQVDNENYFVLYYDTINNSIVSNWNTDSEYEEEELKEFIGQDYDTNYKMANIFYRYNTKTSNVYLSNIIIRNGYNIEC